MSSLPVGNSTTSLLVNGIFADGSVRVLRASDFGLTSSLVSVDVSGIVTSSLTEGLGTVTVTSLIDASISDIVQIQVVPVEPGAASLIIGPNPLSLRFLQQVPLSVAVRLPNGEVFDVSARPELTVSTPGLLDIVTEALTGLKLLTVLVPANTTTTLSVSFEGIVDGIAVDLDDTLQVNVRILP